MHAISHMTYFHSAAIFTNTKAALTGKIISSQFQVHEVPQNLLLA